MASNTYRSRVRIGNWYEDELSQQVQQDLDDRQREHLIDFRSSVRSYLKEEDLSVSTDGLVHLGDKVLLLVPSTLLNKGGVLERRGKVTVSISPSPSVIGKSLSLSGSFLTASPQHLEPCYRNVFTILPHLASQSRGDTLCYGDAFEMGFVTRDGDTTFVTSPPGTAIYSDRSSRRQEVLLEDLQSPYAAWKVVPLGPHEDELMVGRPVEVGEKVRILQLMTNMPLVVEEEVNLKTVFGQEPDVSVGVVNRATTRATPVFTILAWSSSYPKPERTKTPPEDY